MVARSLYAYNQQHVATTLRAAYLAARDVGFSLVLEQTTTMINAGYRSTRTRTL